MYLSGRLAYHMHCCACSVRGGADTSAGSSHGKVRQNAQQLDVILKSGCQRAERVHGLARQYGLMAAIPEGYMTLITTRNSSNTAAFHNHLSPISPSPATLQPLLILHSRHHNGD